MRSMHLAEDGGIRTVPKVWYLPFAESIDQVTRQTILPFYLEKFGSTMSGQFSKLRLAQSIPTSLFSLIFWGVLG